MDEEAWWIQNRFCRYSDILSQITSIKGPCKKNMFFLDTSTGTRGSKYLHIKFIYRKSLATREQFRMDDRGGDLEMIFEV